MFVRQPILCCNIVLVALAFENDRSQVTDIATTWFKSIDNKITWSRKKSIDGFHRIVDFFVNKFLDPHFGEAAFLGVRSFNVFAQKMYCRLCLFETQIPIPLRDEVGNISTDILSTVEKYTGVQLASADCICGSCWSTLDNFRKFCLLVVERQAQYEYIRQSVVQEEDVFGSAEKVAAMERDAEACLESFSGNLERIDEFTTRESGNTRRDFGQRQRRGNENKTLEPKRMSDYYEFACKENKARGSSMHSAAEQPTENGIFNLMQCQSTKEQEMSVEYFYSTARESGNTGRDIEQKQSKENENKSLKLERMSDSYEFVSVVEQPMEDKIFDLSDCQATKEQEMCAEYLYSQQKRDQDERIDLHSAKKVVKSHKKRAKTVSSAKKPPLKHQQSAARKHAGDERNEKKGEKSACICELCGTEAATRVALNAHKRLCIAGRHACGVCQRVLKTTRRLREHMATHTGEYLYRCNYCEKPFKFASTLYAHQKWSHPEEWAQDQLTKVSKEET